MWRGGVEANEVKRERSKRGQQPKEVFAVVARVSMPLLPEWWTVAAWLWLTLAVAWLLRQPHQDLEGPARAGILLAEMQDGDGKKVR
jgi:hypothetical protein